MIKLEDMVSIHLSHIDLDGYASQWLTRYAGYNLVYMNANYGIELDNALEEIVSKTNVVSLLITDLNLNEDQCDMLDKWSKENKVVLMLLDHHITTDKCESYDWYYVDRTKSGALLTNQHVTQLDYKPVRKLISAVNQYDLFIPRDNFKYGAIMNDILTKFVIGDRLHFDTFDRNKAFQILDCALESFTRMSLDNELDMSSYCRLEHDIYNLLMDLDNDLPMFEKDVEMMVNTVQNIDATFKVYYGDIEYKGVLLLGHGGTNYSFFAKEFINKHKLDFVVRVGSRGSVAIRSVGQCDVEKLIAKPLGGGGHMNACGAFSSDLAHNNRKCDIPKVLEALKSKLGQ